MLLRFLPCELQFCEIFSLFWGEQGEEVELANDIWRSSNEKASQRSEVYPLPISSKLEMFAFAGLGENAPKSVSVSPVY